jgi:8-oxo-dGTP pyrophosphatase MutT (NUDIX family)
VHETSAGGLVIDGIDGPHEDQVAALIGRVDRRGRMLWSLPKGHIEQGETAEQTAIREVAEETGIQGTVLAALGSIDYWFVTEGRRVHKTVHHYLMRFSGGELSDEDVEVTEVAWVPLRELPSRLAYADERRLAEVAGELIRTLQTHGPDALPPLPRTNRGGGPRLIHTAATTGPTDPRPAGPTGAGPRRRRRPIRRDRRIAPERTAIAAVIARVVLVMLTIAVLVPVGLPRAGGSEPGATAFLVRIDSVSPDLVTTASEPVVRVTAPSTTSATGWCATSSRASSTPRRRSSASCAPTSAAAPSSSRRSPNS